MDIDNFMEAYKRAWETSDEHLLASLFTADGCYHNTPFACQQGHEAIKAYWQPPQVPSSGSACSRQKRIASRAPSMLR